MEPEEMKKQSKVVDMMLTMHSILADRNSRKAQILEISLVAVSTILVALTFLDPQLLIHLNIRPESARIFIGVCSILIFLLSIIALIVDWKGKARQHREAFKTLIPLKSEWRDLITSYEEYEDRHKTDFSRKSALIIGNLVPIPDSQFNRLKARHYRKVMLSKMITTYPGSSATVLRLHLWYHRNREALNAKSPDEKSHDNSKSSI